MKDYREWELSRASRKQLREQEKERLDALRERIAQAIYKATGEGTLITTMDAIMDVIAKASKEARCEHSACSQNYIDTGDTACIKGGDDE